ncbi:MAG: hypothetical protein IJA27_05825 [Lachnospiraceae bacterium]|nr:hypothetical protein [Lachnospiraceae bacterium]
MSRKSFIITALLINLTICLTLCVVQFTDKDKSEKADTQTTLSEMKGQVTDEPQSDYLNSDEESSDENGINKDSTLEETTSSHQTTETMKNTATNDTTTVAQTTQQATTEAPKEEQSTTKLDLSQVFNPTGETTAFANETVSGTTAVIISSCNIRSSADVAGNIIGTANIGSTYQIDASKCSSNWVAIYLDDATIGYISTSYCSVQ